MDAIVLQIPRRLDTGGASAAMTLAPTFIFGSPGVVNAALTRLFCR